MKLETADILDVRIPSDDGAIARALSKLETGLADWTACIQDIQEKIANHAAGQKQTNCALDRSVEPAVAEAARAPEPFEAPDPEPEMQSASVEAELISPETVELIASEPGSVADDTPMPTSAVEPADAVLPETETIVEAETARETDKGDGEEEQSDEALLNSLPPDMAHDIRVQFRFFDGRKTVQELIENYKAQPKNAKSSWWKRTMG